MGIERCCNSTIQTNSDVIKVAQFETSNSITKNPADPAGGVYLDQAPFSKGHGRGVGHDEVIENLDIDQRQRLT